MVYRYQIYDGPARILARLLRKGPRPSPRTSSAAAHSQSSENLFARRETRNGRVARVRPSSQDVQRRIILGIEDHPITVQVTRASFVFISSSSYLLVGYRQSSPCETALSSSILEDFSRCLPFADVEAREIIRASVKQRLSRTFERGFPRDYTIRTVLKQLI